MAENPRPNDSALTTIPGAARELSMSNISVRRLIKSGRLPAIRFSATMVRIRRADIEKLIREASC